MIEPKLQVESFCFTVASSCNSIDSHAPKSLRIDTRIDLEAFELKGPCTRVISLRDGSYYHSSRLHENEANPSK